MSDDAPRRRPGRPRLDLTDVSVNVNITVTSRTYDALHARASQARVTVPTVIRAAIAQALRVDQRQK